METTPSEASTLALSGQWHHGTTEGQLADADSCSARSGAESRANFRRIFGQLALDPPSLLETKTPEAPECRAHSPLQRCISFSSNPSDDSDPLDLSSDDNSLPAALPEEAAPMPEELLQPRFLIGRQVMPAEHQRAGEECRTSQLLSGPEVFRGRPEGFPALTQDAKEGANTSWTFLRPQSDRHGTAVGRYQRGLGSVPLLQLTQRQSLRSGRKRRKSTLTLSFKESSLNSGGVGNVRMRQRSCALGSSRRTVSLCEDDVIFFDPSYRYNWQRLSLPLSS